MATNGKGAYHGSNTHPARVLRNASAAFMGQPAGTHANAASATTRGGSYGVVGDGDLLVTSTGSLGYSVAPGRVGGPGTFAAYQGWYGGYNDAAVTGNVGARHATLTRVDYIAWRVRDTDEDATGSEDDGIVVIAGTAGSGAPSVPSSLGTLVVLSEVTVPSSAAGTALTFTDRRPRLSALGAPIICTSSTRPTGIALREPTYIFETDTDRQMVWDGAAWIITSEPPQTWTLAVAQPTTVTGTTVRAWYQRSNGVFQAHATWTATGTGTTSQSITTSTPVSLANTEDGGGSFTLTRASSTVYAGSIIPQSTGGLYLFDSGNTSPLGLTPAFALAVGDTIRIDLTGRY